ncbi:MAG: arylesterase [Alphaproteobacteria bacterium]|jgi:acyl-CoA thioesterase-1|nr:arylesterase [Alphaproteobacteria bacterium]
MLRRSTNPDPYIGGLRRPRNRPWFGGALLGLFLSLLFPHGAAAAERVIVAFGDSLVAGYGLAQADAFPAVLQARLRRDGLDVRVRNAGVSGDTTAGGRARLDWALASPVDLVIVELGANDALRGVPPKTAKANLDAILARLKAKGVTVLIAGMRAPPNLGRGYVEAFDAIYPALAAKHALPLYPFFLEGVAARPELNQQDGLHPNAAGVRRIVEGIAPHVKAALPAR